MHTGAMHCSSIHPLQHNNPQPECQTHTCNIPHVSYTHPPSGDPVHTEEEHIESPDSPHWAMGSVAYSPTYILNLHLLSPLALHDLI